MPKAMVVRVTWIRLIVGAAAIIIMQLWLYKNYGEIRYWRSYTTPYEQSTTTATQRETLPITTIGFIGDSNTVIGSPSAAKQCTEVLIDLLANRQINFVNAARGGKAATEWQPDHPEGHLARAVEAFKNAHVKYVAIMLGTNGGAIGEDRQAFDQHLRAICAHLRSLGMVPILNFPPYNPGLDSQGQARMQGVWDTIDKIVKDGVATRGDRRLPEYMRAHPDQTTDHGIHLTQPARAAAGTLWAVAIEAAIRNDQPSTTTRP